MTATGEQIVCAGVRNFVAGDLVPWAKPGSRVPVLPEPLAPRKLRGVMSNGMLCSPRELNIADVHEGILVLNDEPVEVGQDFKAAFGLDDAVLDIEVEPNRPDFLSVFGVAREVSAATGVPLIEPDLRSRGNRGGGVVDRHRADRGRRGLSPLRRPHHPWGGRIGAIPRSGFRRD